MSLINYYIRIHIQLVLLLEQQLTGQSPLAVIEMVVMIRDLCICHKHLLCDYF